MKKILILGTGNAQADFIHYCKESGLVVHACSYKKEGRGVDECDYFHLANITDVDAVKEIVIKHDIDIIYSVGSDIAMPTVTKVASLLDKAFFVSPETAEICNDKLLFRNRLKSLNNGSYTIPYSIINDENEMNKWDIFPSIVKPAKSQGQRGINKIENLDELKRAYNISKEISQNNKVIIEEYIEGVEISVNSYILNGKVMFVFITERNSFLEYPGGIIKSHKHPVALDIDKNEIHNLVFDTCNHLNISNGPVYFQIKVTPELKYKIIEVTPRLDGCHLWRLVKELGGPDMFKIIVNHLSNLNKIDETDFNTATYKADFKSELSFFTQEPGSKMNKLLHKVKENNIYSEWYYENDEIIRTINGYQEKVGYEITY